MASAKEQMAKYLTLGVLFGLLHCGVYTQVAEDPIAGAIETVMETTPASELERLRGDLVSHYDRTRRPDTDAATGVLLYFDVRRIVSLDEKFQTLTVEGIFMMKWEDDRLKWNPSSYSDIKMLHLNIKDIWVPDVYSLFSVKKNDVYKEENVTPVKVYSNGTLKWYPPTVFDVPCSAKYKHYPFDSHNCSILFGSWTHSGFEISLRTLDIPMSVQNSLGAEWMLTTLTHANETFDVDGYFVHKFVRVEFHLKRTSTLYRYVCVLPTIVVFITSMSGFWLLPSDGSRYLVGCSNVVLMSLLLQYLAMTVHAGSEIPLIAQYSATCLCMSGIFLTITVITAKIENSSGSPPRHLLSLANRHMDQFLCLFSFSHSPVDRYSALSEVSYATAQVFPEEQKRRTEWRVVALVVDRISFWIFTFVYIVLFGILASI